MNKSFTVTPGVAETILSSYQKFVDSQSMKGDGLYVKCREKILALTPNQVQVLFLSIYDASMKREEGRQHQFTVILSPSMTALTKKLDANEHVGHGSLDDTVEFETPISISDLPKVATAFDGTSRSLRVWINDEDQFEIWGFGSGYLDLYGLKIHALNLGELLIDIPAQDFPIGGRFLMSFSETNVIQRETPLHRLLQLGDTTAMEGSDEWHRAGHRRMRVFGFVVDIINKMSLHGHGGTLLVIPPEHAESVLKTSIKERIPIRPKGNYSSIKNKLRQEEDEQICSMHSDRKNLSLPWSFDREADLIGQFTAADGATIITTEFDVLGIGAKIKETGDTENAQINILVQDAYAGAEPQPKTISQLGGTRHQSAARFVYDRREENVFAIVASQDGKVSVIYCDEKKQLRSFTHAEYSYRGLKYSN